MSQEFWQYTVGLDECRRVATRAALPAPRSVTRIPRGEVNAIFDLSLSDGRRVVLKVQRRADRPEALLREREACLLLADVPGVGHPQSIDINLDKDILPYNYSLLTYVPGVDGDEAWSHRPPPEQIGMVRSLGETLARMHSHVVADQSDCHALPVGRSSQDWAALQRARFEDLSSQHSACGYLPSALLDEVRDFWAEREALLDQAPPLCLLHGDYQLWNVRIQPGSTAIAGVVDLDQTDIGDPAFDFAAMEAGVLADRTDLREAFYDAYGSSSPTRQGFRDRVALYTLLRHLDMMIAYQGPVRFEHGGSSAEAIARLVTSSGTTPTRSSSRTWQVLRAPATARPGEAFRDPARVDEIDGRYLAHVVAEGLGRPVAVTYWHLKSDQSWQDFAGRGGDSIIAYQMAARIEGLQARERAVILKLTTSPREAMLYAELAPLLAPHVPKPYHVVLRPPGGPYWIFLEYVPCMVLGPLWEGGEYAKAIEGLAAIHARLWRQPGLLRGSTWLPRFDARRCLDQCRAEIACLEAPWDGDPAPAHLRRLVTALAHKARRSEQRIGQLAHQLARQPFTLVHGDYHLANIGTRERTPSSPPVLADWAGCSFGPRETDLACFLGAIEGLTRPKPTREAIVGEYVSLLRRHTGDAVTQRDFEPGLTAATFFDDLHALARLLTHWEEEASWRGTAGWTVEEETGRRVERAISVLASEPQ